MLLVVALKFTGSSQYPKARTSQVVKLMETRQVRSAIFNDPAQVIQITTSTSARYEAARVGDQGDELATLPQHQVDAAQLPTDLTPHPAAAGRPAPPSRSSAL